MPQYMVKKNRGDVCLFFDTIKAAEEFLSEVKDNKRYDQKIVKLEERQFNDGAYRRGFMHGLCTAVDMLKCECSLEYILDYINNPVTKWRFDMRLDKLIEPPNFQADPGREFDGI